MIIVTGGAGFIGSALIWEMNRQGITDILVVDSLKRSPKWKNLNNLVFQDYIDKTKFLEYLDRNAFGPSISGILHMGACSSTTEMDLNYLVENNFEFSKHLAIRCTQNNWRMVYASSAATYGDGQASFSDRADIRHFKPLNPYGFSKQLFDAWADRHQLLDRITGLKFFNVYGPNEYHKETMRSVVIKTYQSIRETGRMELFQSHRPDYHDGEQARDFIYIKDVVRLTLSIFHTPGLCGLYNIGTGQSRTFRDLALAVFAALQLPPAVSFIPMPESIRSQYQYYTQADISKLTESFRNCRLDFPEIPSMEERIRDYICHYATHEDPYLGNSSEANP